jgi:tRNA(Arg) A34 adenosine deaminase TadA
MISVTDLRYITHAAYEAEKSPVLMRHGAVAVVNGKIVGRGHNHYRSTSRDNFIKNTCTCHAEIACLRNMFYTYGTNTYGKNSIPIKVV